jgi:Peptidase family C50
MFPSDDVFAKFRLTFRQILAKFLPGRKEKDVPLELDPRLVDLFLSLTSDKPEVESDVADQVEDLICFALDNFKFHGEQIAIDEVDLDAACNSDW